MGRIKVKVTKKRRKSKVKNCPTCRQILEEIRDTMDKVSFDFTKSEYIQICEEAMLSELQKELFEDKIKGLTIVEMSMKHNISPETVKRQIQKLKKRIMKVI